VPTSWRILKTKYATSPFDGEGARLNGGRWSSPGRPVVYTADSAALATLEILVHLLSSSTLSYYSLASAAFPSSEVTTMTPADLPPNWQASPAPPELQRIGDLWLDEARYAVLQVPSAIVPSDSNYLLNPQHPGFGGFTFGPLIPYGFDPRLAKP